MLVGRKKPTRDLPPPPPPHKQSSREVYDELQTSVDDYKAERAKKSHKLGDVVTNGIASATTVADSNPFDTATNVISALPGQVTDNPIIGEALNVLTSLAHLGETIPYVAPAFVVLKFIIGIEQKAREADAKCNDLLERITFMIGHLAVLDRVKVMDQTRRVIEKMNGVLKESASLIQAYRKQGKIARRLNTGNKDKFVGCAESINSCSADLMMSLQIQQTGQLDILARSVPIDPEDEAAQIFIAQHGGDGAAIRGDTSLVTQFAQEMHIEIDSESMAQLNTNISALMAQNQAQLENVLSESVGAAVMDGLVGLAKQMNEAEKEQAFTCVQCGKEYRESTSGPASCKFHRAEYDGWRKIHPCCGGSKDKSPPCQTNAHRSEHHCEYPYSSFFERAWGITNYVDTIDWWTKISDTNLETNAEVKASAGQLLRWKSKSGRIEQPTILVTVGAIYYNEPYFFDTFDAPKLKAAEVAGKSLIYKTSANEEEYAMAEWVFDGRVLAGLRISAKSATSTNAFVTFIPLDLSACTKSEPPKTLSSGGLLSYKPDPGSSYTLPEPIKIGPTLNDQLRRPVRKDFKTRTSPSFPVILKVNSDPPLSANSKFAHPSHDKFEGTISIFNKHPAGSANPITIASFSALFRLVGDEAYLPVQLAKVLDAELPVTIEPRQAVVLRFLVEVPRSEEAAKLGINWWNRAFVSRHRPLRLKLVLADIEDEEASLVVEHIHDPYELKKPAKDDIAFVFYDDHVRWERRAVPVLKGENADAVIRFDWRDISTKMLQRTVYRALDQLRKGEDVITEVDLEAGKESSDGTWSCRVFALVDVSRQVVYAFKVVLLQGGKLGAMAYVPCPEYGDVVEGETKAVQPAVEKARFEPMEESVVRDNLDDTVDDVVPEVAKDTVPTVSAAAAIGASVAGGIAPSPELMQRLNSIDDNLARIASVLEVLVSNASAGGAGR